MSVRITPEVRKVVCDCCSRFVGEGGCARRQSGALHLRRHALDMQGHACANADVKIDLCDDCLSAIGSAINEACVKVRAKAAGDA